MVVDANIDLGNILVGVIAVAGWWSTHRKANQAATKTEEVHQLVNSKFTDVINENTALKSENADLKAVPPGDPNTP